MKKISFLRRAWVFAFLAVPSLALSQLDLGTNDASDGDLIFTSNTTIDLNRAVPAAWNAPSPIPGFGVYDGQKWAVVFKCNNLTINPGVEVKFISRLLGGNPPVVFLVQGNAQINGVLNLDSGTRQSDNVGPPGGFGAGDAVALNGSFAVGSGRGPGGPASNGLPQTSSAGYSQPGSGPNGGRLYGNPSIIPLVGGSSSGRKSPNAGDLGVGGGAVLIACRNQMTITGTIRANSHEAAGGAIKLLADSIAGPSSSVLTAISTLGPNFLPSSSGRIRLEFNTSTYAGNIQPLPSVAQPTVPITIWPSNQDPNLIVEAVGSITVPTDPNASWQLTQEDVTLFSDNPVVVRVRAFNVPTNWKVDIRIVPRIGATIVQQATMISGNQLESVWEATVTFPRGQCAVQARAWL